MEGAWTDIRGPHLDEVLPFSSVLGQGAAPWSPSCVALRVNECR